MWNPFRLLPTKLQDKLLAPVRSKKNVAQEQSHVGLSKIEMAMLAQRCDQWHNSIKCSDFVCLEKV